MGKISNKHMQQYNIKTHTQIYSLLKLSPGEIAFFFKLKILIQVYNSSGREFQRIESQAFITLTLWFFCIMNGILIGDGTTGCHHELQFDRGWNIMIIQIIKAFLNCATQIT